MIDRSQDRTRAGQVTGTGTPTTSALSLVDYLLDLWSHWEQGESVYVSMLEAVAVRWDRGAELRDREGKIFERLELNEQKIFEQLKALLYPDEWADLPSLVQQRRRGDLRRLRSDYDRERARCREEEERRAREEAIRIEKAAQQRKKAEEERRQQEASKRLRKRLDEAFETNFLSADEILRSHPDGNLIGENEYARLKAEFVQNWADREVKPRLDPGGERPFLDLEQAAAVGATGGDTQVIARAGSGKTRTLVTRALFLQQHCGVSPREILLLAFNRTAANEMRSRLAEALGKDLPHTMTFHALAYALVKPQGRPLRDNPKNAQFGLSEEIQGVIDERLRSSEWQCRIRDLMLAHFREDWERIERGRFCLARDEFLEYRYQLPRETLNGEFVKSCGEKLIANTLFEHGIEYKYERSFRWDGKNWRPDFTILPNQRSLPSPKGIVVEYFGEKDDPDYDPQAEEKRGFWNRQNEWEFLEFRPSDVGLGAEAFQEELLRQLRKFGILATRLSEDEIWELVRKRAVDGLTKALTTFIGRCRKGNLAPDDLDLRIEHHIPCLTSERYFLELAASVYRGYLARLSSGHKKYDDDGMLWEAVQEVRNGKTSFVRDKGTERGDVAKLNYILIDEFQDFSQAFFDLCMAIRTRNPRAEFFCVGDDWQAINRFAGSELRFFEGFETDFRDPSVQYVATNYRSAPAIVTFGNEIMKERGKAAVPSDSAIGGEVLICYLDRFSPSAAEQERHNGDEITPAVLRLVKRFLDCGMRDVVMLARGHRLPWYVREAAEQGAEGPLERYRRQICGFFPEEDHSRIKVDTVHRFKGGEGEAVIVLDAVVRSFPLIHPNWVFNRILGESIPEIEAEERRLFYVAVTRAKKMLALITEGRRESPFLREIERIGSLSEDLQWGDLAPVASPDVARWEVRVSGETFEVKDLLKRAGYKFRPTHDKSNRREWRKVIPAGPDPDRQLAQILREPWAIPGITIVIYTEEGDIVTRGAIRADRTADYARSVEGRIGQDGERARDE